MRQKRILLKNASLYGVISFLTTAINFFLFPLYTFYLSPTEFGIRGVLQSVIGLLSVIYTLGLNMTIMKYYSEYSKDKDKLNSFVSSIANFVLINSVVTSLVLILFKNIVFDFLAHGINFFPYILIALMIVTFQPIFGIVQTLHQAKQEASRYTIWNFIYFAVNALTILSSLIVLNGGFLGLLLSQLFTTTIFMVFSLINIYKEYGFSISKADLKVALNYCVPLLPHSMSGWIIDMVDRLLLNNMKSTSSVGFYNIGYSISQVLSFVVSAIHQAFNPWFMQNLNNIQYRDKISRIVEMIIWFYMLIALTLSLFGYEILKLLVHPSYVSSWSVIPFISFSYVFIGAYYFFGYLLMYDINRARYINIATFFSAGVNFGLNIILIPLLGIIGTAFTTLFTYILSSIITYHYAKKNEAVKFNVIKIYLIICFGLLILPVLLLHDHLDYWIFLLLKIFLLLLAVLIFLINYNDELQKMINELGIIEIIKKKISYT